jgi:hypothetical protein
MWTITRSYAESYKSRHGKYPPGYNPENPEPEPEAQTATEALQRECDDSPEDLDDAWDQYDEEQAAAKTVKGIESCTDWIDEFRGLIEPGDMPAPPERERKPWKPPEEDKSAPELKPQRSAAELVNEAVRAASNQRELRQDCPSFWINKKLANCREIHNDTELKAIGLLNTLMMKHGYAYVSNEQFALWMRMKNTESARHFLARLAKRELIENIDRQRDRMKWVVRQDLQNPKRAVCLYSKFILYV